MLIERRCYSLNDISLYDTDVLFCEEDEGGYYDEEEEECYIPTQPFTYYQSQQENQDALGYCHLTPS